MSYAKQSEILFLWDGENWNPNGDMLNSNAPRYDEISRKALVSDVRIKRTIRDFLYSNGDEIFVREDMSNKGGICDAKERGFRFLTASEFFGGEKEYREFLKKAKNNKHDFQKFKDFFLQLIDIRAFGAVIPSYGTFNDKEKKQHLMSINITGAIQFKMSKSLNQTEINFVKGTGAFASEAGDSQKTFREEYTLPYALFGTYGVVNALASESTKLTDNDVEKIINALWFGTKNLISRSKFGQLPRFLLRITYKEAGCYIGGLDNLVKLKTDKPQENEIKSTADYSVDLSLITAELSKYKDKIESIEYVTDGNINIEGIGSDWKKLDFGI